MIHPNSVWQADEKTPSSVGKPPSALRASATRNTEAERCIKDLGFSGIQMAAHDGELYLNEDQFKPDFKFLDGP